MEEIDVKVMVAMCGGIKIKALCIRVLFLVNYLLELTLNLFWYETS